MPNPDVKIAVGDVVHVRARVIQVRADGRFQCQPMDRLEGHGARRDDIVHVEPRPLQVGEEVKASHIPDVTWKVLAIDDGVAWCKHSPARRSFFDIRELTRFDIRELTRIPNTCGSAGNA